MSKYIGIFVFVFSLFSLGVHAGESFQRIFGPRSYLKDKTDSLRWITIRIFGVCCPGKNTCAISLRSHTMRNKIQKNPRRRSLLSLARKVL